MTLPQAPVHIRSLRGDDAARWSPGCAQTWPPGAPPPAGVDRLPLRPGAGNHPTVTRLWASSSPATCQACGPTTPPSCSSSHSPRPP